MTKILDISQSIQAANGNVGLARDLFTMLLEDLDSRLELIENSFHDNDMGALEEHVHKLYGATAYCIVPKLREHTGVLEDQLRSKNYNELENRVQAVLHEIKQLIEKGPALVEDDWTAYASS